MMAQDVMVACRRPPGTTAFPLAVIHPHPKLRPRLSVPSRSPARTAACLPSSQHRAARETSSGPFQIDLPYASASLSQPPSHERCDDGLRPLRYLSIRYTERLGEAGIAPSVGSVGDSYDNALAETVIGLFKTEVTAVEARGGPSSPSSSPPSNGWTGSTTGASSSPSATSHPPKLRPASTSNWRPAPRRRRTQTKQPPGNPVRFTIGLPPFPPSLRRGSPSTIAGMRYQALLFRLTSLDERPHSSPTTAV